MSLHIKKFRNKSRDRLGVSNPNRILRAPKNISRCLKIYLAQEKQKTYLEKSRKRYQNILIDM